MKKCNTHIYVLAYVLCAVVLILQTQTTISAIREAIMLCIETVIPSLLPFIALTLLFGPKISIRNVSVLAFLAGYPVGAQTVCNAYRYGTVRKEDAERMLSYINNAGPAFIFGIAGSLFSNKFIPWIIWGIQILSALCVKAIFCGVKPIRSIAKENKMLSVREIAVNSVQTMGCICFWIIVFRVIIRFLEMWVLFRLSPVAQICVKGLLELTNGCLDAKNIGMESIRFILITTLVASGGLCVTLQTLSLTGDVRPYLYFLGKLLQTILSFIFSYLIQQITFEDKAYISPYILAVIAVSSIFSVLIIKKRKFTMEKPRRILYNQEKV